MFLAFNRGLSSEVLQGPFPKMLFTEGTYHARRWCQWQGGLTHTWVAQFLEDQYVSFVQCVPGQAQDCQLLLHSRDHLILLLIRWVLLAVSFQIWIHFRFPFHLSWCVLITQLGGKTRGFEGLLWSCVTLRNLHSWWFFKTGEQFLWHTLAQQHLWSGLGRGPAGGSGDIEGWESGYWGWIHPV